MIETPLPYPHKLLWPNGRTRSPHAKARETKKHKEWAWAAAKPAMPSCFTHNGEPLPVHVIVHGKPKGPLPDKDNVSAACKAYLDGIAEAIGVNDRLFGAPTVEFAERTANGGFVVRVG